MNYQERGRLIRSRIWHMPVSQHYIQEFMEMEWGNVRISQTRFEVEAGLDLFGESSEDRARGLYQQEST